METNKIISLISKIREYANLLIADELAKRGVHGLVASHGNILVKLYQNGPLPMSNLAKLIGKKKNTLTVLVRKLNKEGYVDLRKSEMDNRVTLVGLTKKGEEFRKDFEEISQTLLKQTWGEMPLNKQEDLCAGLKTVLKNLNK